MGRRGPSGGHMGPYGGHMGPGGIGDGINLEHHQNVNEHLVTSRQCNCATGMKHTVY